MIRLKIVRKSTINSTAYYFRYNGIPRKTWETINEVTRRKSDKATIKELEINGTRITNSAEITDGFNFFFSQKSDPNCPGIQEKLPPPSMSLKP